MTMVPKPREIPAAEFKAKCLAILDEVAETGEEIVVTKRGKPVARVAPMRLPRGSMKGTVLFEADDIITPLDFVWEAEQ